MRLVIAFVLAAAAAVGTAAAADVHHDFRQKQFDPRVVKTVGPNAAALVKREDAGLRIALPAKGGPKGPAGVAYQSFLRGDFTVTVAYELLPADAPPAGKMVGVTAYLMFDGPTDDGIMFGRLQQRDGPPIYRVTHMVKGEGGKRQGRWAEKYPTTAKTAAGTLRLTRTGTTLALAAAPAGSAEFQPVASLTAGPDDVKLLRIAAEPDGADTPVEVRVTDLRIRAERLLSEGEARASKRTTAASPAAGESGAAAGEPAPDEGTRPLTGTRKWLLWGVLGGGVVLALVGVGVRVVTRRRAAADDAPGA